MSDIYRDSIPITCISNMTLEVSMAEVEQHKDGQGGVWTVIHNKVLALVWDTFMNIQVYDVSAFLAEHPGGAAILEENSGVHNKRRSPK